MFVLFMSLCALQYSLPFITYLHPVTSERPSVLPGAPANFKPVFLPRAMAVWQHKSERRARGAWGVYERAGLAAAGSAANRFGSCAEMSDGVQSQLLNDAARLREKYSLKDKNGARLLQKITLEELCVHPQNRAGTFPSAARVKDLLCGIMRDRFLANEAQHEAVVIQELPFEKRADFQRLRGKPYTTHSEHNKKHTESVEALKSAFTCLSTFNYGAVSHCTLSLGLQSIKHEAAWDLPEEHKGKGLEAFQTGPGGSWDVSKMRQDERFSELVEVLDNGLRCEILSWEIHLDKDHVEAPALIAAALNNPQGKGVTTHEMEILKSVAEHASAAAAAAQGEVDFDRILTACASRYPLIGSQMWFVDLFKFVIGTGGQDGPFIPQILDYDRRWVDHSKRTLAQTTWNVLNQVGDKYPHVKVALVMRAYSEDPRSGICPSPESGWTKQTEYRLENLNALLGYFRSEVEVRAAEVMTADQSATITSQLIIAATEAFYQIAVKQTAKKPFSEIVSHVCAAFSEFCGEVRQAWLQQEKNASKQFPLPPSPWATGLTQAWEERDRSRSSGSGGVPTAVPVLIKFDAQGRPTNSQMAEPAQSSSTPMMVVPVHTWHPSQASVDLDYDRRHQAAITEVMSALHHDPKTCQQPVQMQYDIHKKSVHVVVTEAVGPGSLKLFPCCPTVKTFSKATTNQRAVELQVGEQRPNPAVEMQQYWAVPDLKLPPLEKECSPGDLQRAAEDQPAISEGQGGPDQKEDAKEEEGQQSQNPYQWKFAGTESLHFFWAVDAMTTEELAKAQLQRGQEHWNFNVDLYPKTFRTMIHGADSMRVMEVVVPYMSNTEMLSKGDRLILRITKEKKVPDGKKDKDAWQIENEKSKKRKQEEAQKAAKGAQKKQRGVQYV